MTDFGTLLSDLLRDEGGENVNGTGVSDVHDLPLFKELCDFLTDTGKDHKDELQPFLEGCARLCDTPFKQSEFTTAGVALLSLFIQKNWTGPDVTLSEKISQINNFGTRADILKELVVDGENVVPVVELPNCLYVAKAVLEIAWRIFKDSEVAKIWYLRTLFIHQQILEELSPELFEKISLVIDKLKVILNGLPKLKRVTYYLEFSRIFMYYNYVQKSKLDVSSATELAGLQVSLSGALGRRTKFQSQDLAQLILKVDIANKEKEEELLQKVSYCTLPKDVKLDDDVRLDKIKYADHTQTKCPDLTGLQQAVILANLFQIQKSQPKDSLADEELQPLISCILDQGKVWPIRMTTLLLRSKLEATHKRTVERAMMQVQVLSESAKDPQVTLKQRFAYFFISHLPPKWEVQSMLANVLISMGSIKSALEIYQSLEEWESVIFCYNALQMRHKAQEIIEQELRKEPSPKLWCLLGDATDDVSCYEKAWDLSNKRSARAQRHWAHFYYHRKNYAECIEHFQKSLEINSLQKELWYRLGYAALVEEKWEVSAHAYRRYCVLDPECFEAWNNLARCYCELKQKYRAWRALQEALKVDYSNWKVWDNYMLVSSDLQMFEEVIRSYHQILKLKEKHLDVPVLNSLVVGFKNWKEGDAGEGGKFESLGKFRSKLLELFGRLTSQIFNDAELWFLYSEVVDTESPESLLKKHQLLMKAHRSAINKADWEKNLENCDRVIYVLSSMLRVGLQTEKPDVLMSCKLAAGGTLAKIRMQHREVEITEELEKNLDKLDKILEG